MRGLYSKPGFPHKGWVYWGCEDLGDLIGRCDICGSSLRYEHTIRHRDYGYIKVGCQCCENILSLGDYEEAKRRDKYMRERTKLMKAFKDYYTTKAYGSGTEQLPKGGYVCKIMKASVESGQYGEQLVVALDIAEGDYKDFFANEYRAQDREDKKWHGNYYLSIPTDDGSEKDGWTKRKFKTFTNAVEDSNAGYTWNWDENTLKGKLFGGLFIEKERLYQGKIYTSTICGGATSIGAIKEGKYKLPKDRPVKNAPAGTRSASDTGSDFISVPEGAGEEGLPF